MHSAASVDTSEADAHGVFSYLQSLRAEQKRCPGKHLRCPSSTGSKQKPQHQDGRRGGSWVVCKGAVPHSRIGLPDCFKIEDLNGNTGVTFAKQKEPSISFHFELPQKSFKVLWLYKHPSIHKQRQLQSMTVFCHHASTKTQVAVFKNVQDTTAWKAVASGWIKLPLERKCPSVSRKWELKHLKGGSRKFYVMDLLLGDDDTERQLLPLPASSKINGYCLHQQQLPADRPGWRAMSWQRDQWQSLLSFKPDTSKIPAGSTLLVQLMFDEVRSDWPSQQLSKLAINMGWNTACTGSVVSKCSAAQNAGFTFTIMDS